MANLAKLVVRLEAESSQLRRELEKTNKKLTGFGNTAKKTLGSVTTAFKGMVGAFVGFQAVSAVVREVSSLEKSLSNVEAVSGATAKQMDALTKSARQLGATTTFSATEAAQGMEFLGRAGFKTVDIIQAMPGLLDLAAAGALELGTAADIASNVLSGFNLEATRTTEVADVLAATAAGSNTSVEQLGLAMSYVAPVAAALGKSVQETSAAIGILGNAGIQASTAGTALRGMLSRLASVTPEAAKALSNLKIKVEELNPETKSFVEIIDRLAESGIGAGDALTIFGDRAGPAVLALVSQNSALRDFVLQMDGAGGSARRMAEVMNDNLTGDTKALGSAVSELIQKLGEGGLTSVLRTSVQGLTDFARWVGKLVEGDSLEELAKKLDKVNSASGSSRASRRRRSGVNKIQEEIQNQLEQLEGSAGVRAQLSRVESEVNEAAKLVQRIQDKINAVPAEDRIEGSIGSGRSKRDTPWSRLNKELGAATKELEAISDQRQQLFDELFDLESKTGSGGSAARDAAAAVEALAQKRILAAEAVANAEKNVVTELENQRKGFDQIVKDAQALIKGETKNPMTDGTLVEALRALDNAKTLESGGDSEGAFNKAKETIGMITKLVEAGDLSKQFAASLVDQAATIGEKASDQLIELKLDEAGLEAQAARARQLIQANFSAEPFTATIQWMNPGMPSTPQLPPGGSRPDGTPIVFNMPDGSPVEITAVGENVNELRRSLGTYVDKNGTK